MAVNTAAIISTERVRVDLFVNLIPPVTYHPKLPIPVVIPDVQGYFTHENVFYKRDSQSKRRTVVVHRDRISFMSAYCADQRAIPVFSIRNPDLMADTSFCQPVLQEDRPA